MMGKLLSTVVVAAVLVLSTNAGPVKKAASLADEHIAVITEIIFDYGTHVLQTGKAGRAINDGSAIPFHIARQWSFDYTKQVCSANNTDCEQVHEEIHLGGKGDGDFYATTWLEGFNGNDVQVKIEMNNFSYLFSVENLEFVSIDYQRISTRLSTGVQLVYSGMHLQVANSSLGITGDFEFSDGTWKVSNVKVLLDLGRVHMKIDQVSKNDNGSWTDLEPIEEEAAPQVMEMWRETDENGVTLETRYSSFIEDKINDFLAGRSTF